MKNIVDLLKAEGKKPDSFEEQMLKATAGRVCIPKDPKVKDHISLCDMIRAEGGVPDNLHDMMEKVKRQK